MKHKQLIRERFKEAVFKRDNYKCKVCKTNDAERFHLSGDKKWLPNFHPDDLYKLIDSSYELAIEKSKKLKEKL